MSIDPMDPRPATTEALLRFLESVPESRETAGAAGGSGPEGGGPESGGPEHDAGDGAGRWIARKGCPPAHAYMGVALGTSERGEGQALLDHATGCSQCAQSLAASLRALDGDPSDEETDALAELTAVQPHVQRQISRRLAVSRAVRRPLLGPGGYGRWIGLAAAAAVTVVAAGAGILWHQRAGAPDRLLARAYEDSRTLELRIPEAAFSSLKPGAHTRGNSAGTEAPSLLEARAKLARTLEKSPQDDRSLALEARADLLEEHYDAAIDALDRLIAKGPATAELLVDGATAYFERGLVTGRELDRSTALDYLRRADLMSPADPVVLFNEAIVMQDRGQLMNAVEVWNRYMAVERDPQWAAEGKRKLADLEITLDRLKSHESRLMRMLATPQSMDALAEDAARLRQWDEELSSVELDKLTGMAFPLRTGQGQEQARGSPCPAQCAAARRLLLATGISLQQHHNDDWLRDLLSPSIPQLTPEIQAKYTQAMHLLGNATRENQTDQPDKGERFASEARRLFAEIGREGDGDASLRRAAEAAEARAAAEYLFALQRQQDFAGCRVFAKSEAARESAEYRANRYPWIETLSAITRKICFDTPETRTEGNELGMEALRLASDAHYTLLTARVRLHMGAEARTPADQEKREEEILGSLRELIKADPPPIRIVNPLASLTYTEYPSPRLYAASLAEKEAVAWSHLAGDWRDEVSLRMHLGVVKIRLGYSAEAQEDFHLAAAIAAKQWPGEAVTAVNNSETTTAIAEALLERGDADGARQSLNAIRALRRASSDAWARNQYVAVTGQFALEQHDTSEAERVLAEQIRLREVRSNSGGDLEEREIAEQDHDLYGELAAVWLEEGRPAMDVLALWERFRLRLQGLPVPRCTGGRLDCGREALEAERERMEPSVLTGEIVLMDRILVYEMDGRGVRWSTRKYSRQDALDAVHTLDRAASSPAASLATVQSLGMHLADLLLPTWKNRLPEQATLLLEPDPELRGIPWPVLPTAWGPLGLNFAVAEIPSILSPLASRPEEMETILREENHGRPLLIGASVSGGDQPPLPEAMEEAQRVESFFHAPTLLLGSRATTRNVAAALSAASVLHFAGHAVEEAADTRLLLARSSPADTHPWIDESFLRSHPPRACRLAVLSACTTGGDDRTSDGTTGNLVKTLTALGVPQVVATRWQVDSEASLPFMKTFYESLRSGHTVAHALLAARRLQATDPLYNKPYFWGAYYVTGRERTRSEGELHASTEGKSHVSKDSAKERTF